MNAAGAVDRVTLQPAYVLHHRPYRETSRIVELFTRDRGRLTVFARGTRGKRKAGSLISMLQPFHRVLVSYSGRGEAAQLTGAEFDGPFDELPSARSLSGFYLNELLMRLFERHDPHADAFDLYDATMTALKDSRQDESRLLRIFEKRLLETIGYGLSLGHEAQSGVPVRADAVYRYTPERGLTLVEGVAEGGLLFSGASLLSLRSESLNEPATRTDARRLLRAALDQYLAGRELHSREVLAELREMRKLTTREA
jgi:DNA repair protein RecO (recombination protein O)